MFDLRQKRLCILWALKKLCEDDIGKDKGEAYQFCIVKGKGSPQTGSPSCFLLCYPST